MNFPNPSMPSVMGHTFSQVPHADIPRSSFKRSHGYKTTFDENYLVPIFVDEALPGDTFNAKLSSICRLNTPLKPIMDNVYIDFFFFAVPNRLLWDSRSDPDDPETDGGSWERFCGDQHNPGDSTDFLVPTLDPALAPLGSGDGGFPVGSLSDYFGIPIGVEGLNINSLHYRAYNLIWNEWFRDENLQERVAVPLGGGPDDPALYELLKRGKRHDYFTSCLPWPQKGDAVDLPLGSIAPVITMADDRAWDTDGEDALRMWQTGANPTPVFPPADRSIGVGAGTGDVYSTGQSRTMQEALSPSNLFADLNEATAASINSLREAFQLQRLLERDARGGTRYTEIIRAHFRVDSPDARLQRPEYLGGGQSQVNFEPVANTANVTYTSAPENIRLGDLGAAAFSAQSGIGFSKSFVEHSVIIGLINVRADLTYQKGLDRMWSRQTKYDYYWPALAHLGEQEVLNKEIYAQGTGSLTPGEDELAFGYQERWAEYRYAPSKITGAMRSPVAPIHATSLDVWHLSQDFTSLPTLSSQFIEEDVPMDRVVAVPSEPTFKLDAYFDVTCARPMPMYSVPGLIDHF